ncbi:MAG: efflux RND transporter periplasmic adaptor subunit [Aestuariivirgaceae bacterium]
MVKRFIIIGVVFGLLIGGLAFFHFVFLPKMIEQAIRGAPPPTETVSAEKVRSENWAPFVKAIGTVQAVSGIEVPAKTTGTVRKYFFESGADVKEGDPLVQLDDDSEQADLRNLQASLKNAEQELERNRNLAKQGISPRRDLQAAEARRAEFTAQIDKIQVVIQDKLIRAPWAGRLGIRKVDVGSYVQPGQTLVWLQTVDPVYVDFTVPENEVARLKAGQALEASFSAYPQEIFTGKIDVMDAKIDEATRAIAVRGVLPNPEGKILPGMFADVRVIVDAPQPVLTVARTAVTYSLYGVSVYVVIPAKSPPAATSQTGGQSVQPSAEPALQVERRFVKAGEVRGDRVSVFQGLKEGEEVVTVGQLKLRPGTNIRIDNSVALNKPVATGTE